MAHRAGPPWLIASALAVLALASWSAAGAEVGPPVSFGRLRIAYDADLWTASDQPDGLRLTCKAEACRGWSVTGSLAGPCGAGSRPGSRRTTVEGRRGLVWQVERWFAGCRNLHPPNLDACAEVDGVRHRLVAGVPGCRSAPAPGSERVLDDLLRAAEPLQGIDE